jgi:ankyrin repeat protein
MVESLDDRNDFRITEDAMNIFEAIEMDDLAAASAMLAADPSLASELGEEGATPVLHALSRQNDSVAHALAAQIKCSGGLLTLAEASGLDDVEVVRAALAAGAPVDGRTPDGFTPLQLAAFFGAPQAAQALIAAGADVNAVADNPMRIQPLHAAAAGQHGEIATMLIEAGAAVDTAQRHGWTPLHTAAHNGDAELARELLAAGAPVDVTNDDGRTPADVAIEAGYPDLIRAVSS